MRLYICNYFLAPQYFISSSDSFSIENNYCQRSPFFKEIVMVQRKICETDIKTFLASHPVLFLNRRIKNHLNFLDIFIIN